MAKTPTKAKLLPDANDIAGQMMIAERVLIVSAPAGPRRRANISFGSEPIELRLADLGDDPEATLEQLRADPFLKIDGRFEERPAEPADLPAGEPAPAT
ncbi:hypothetical protein DEM27_32645 [Metarhizobium album]|uniref:Mu-like prophage FluMu N-terminal domain-containing protein n=1 Tax=Metarhizobium album TaxID=2182425 RepID=A0A2U2DFT2_9HYPH|nr:hypothetical protein [Rhizobium album]PWE52150.1 hypothetical protein DEM27_32645 [Rhizobium album]